MDLVSVIIPAYNSEKYLSEAVESAVSNDWPDKEIIIVDDGSTDGTRHVACGLERSHGGVVRFLPSADGRNRGVSHARNRAAREARGEMLSFLDADDRFLQDHLASSVGALRERPEVAFTYARIRYLFDMDREALKLEGDEWGSGPARGIVPDAFERLLERNFIPLQTVVCRREQFLQAGGFDEGLEFQHEDYLLWAKLSCRHPLFYLDRVGAEYRIHPASYSTNLRRDVVVSAQEVEFLERVSRAVGESDRQCSPIVRAAWRRVGDRVAHRLYCALRKGDFVQARREFAALRRVPEKLRLAAAPWNWHRNRSGAQHKTELGARQSRH
jgi:glycosyltransferase involved in cell wall biosynthesis